MCNFFSGIIVDKNKKVLWHPDIDSHTELLEHFKIKDESHQPNFVRVEFSPADGNAFNHDFKTWTFKTDQDFRPDWYDEEASKELMLSAVKKLIDERFVINRVLKETKQGRFWVGDGGTVQEVLNGGTVQKVLNGGTVQKVWDGGTVQEVLNGGTVQEVLDSGIVVYRPYGKTPYIVTGNPRIEIKTFEVKK